MGSWKIIYTKRNVLSQNLYHEFLSFFFKFKNKGEFKQRRKIVVENKPWPATRTNYFSSDVDRVTQEGRTEGRGRRDTNGKQDNLNIRVSAILHLWGRILPGYKRGRLFRV